MPIQPPKREDSLSQRTAPDAPHHQHHSSNNAKSGATPHQIPIRCSTSGSTDPRHSKRHIDPPSGSTPMDSRRASHPWPPEIENSSSQRTITSATCYTPHQCSTSSRQIPLNAKSNRTPTGSMPMDPRRASLPRPPEIENSSSQRTSTSTTCFTSGSTDPTHSKRHLELHQARRRWIQEKPRLQGHQR